MRNVDIRLDYNSIVKLSDDEVLNLLQRRFPKRGLHTISYYWRESNDYILRANGINGNVVVLWK